MTIPSIEPYLLPAPHELPTARVAWKPDPARAVLLIHDMQRYFLRSYTPSQSPLREALANAVALRAFAQRMNVPVVYSAQPADPVLARRGLLSDVWGPGLTAHPEEQEIAPELSPLPGDKLLQKTRYSAFHGTELLSLLRDQGRDQLWICGVFAHIGCMLTAFDAFMNDVKPFMVADALADFSREHHELSLSMVASRCGVVLDTATLCGLSRNEDQGVRLLVQAELSELLSAPLPPRSEDLALGELGLDSVRRMELIERLYTRGLALSAVDLMECETLGQLLDLSAKAQAESAQGRAS
jgi:bifunctional isochorismate lyase/aryl carrier protein